MDECLALVTSVIQSRTASVTITWVSQLPLQSMRADEHLQKPFILVL